MSVADKMFEELGTIKTETESFITYTGKINKSARILFDKNDETIIFENFNSITTQELQAINKKVEELGWIE